MGQKRTITVEFLGQKYNLKTTESEDEVKEDLSLVEAVYREIQDATRSPDTLHLFVLTLLHLGRKLRLLEREHKEFVQWVEENLQRIVHKVESSLSFSQQFPCREG